MRAQFFGPDASTTPTSERAGLRASTPSPGSGSTSATATASIASSRATPRTSSSSSTPRPSPRTTGPPRTRRPTSPSTRTERSTSCRPRATTAPTRRSSSCRRTRSTATGRTSSRSRSPRRAWSCPRTTAGTTGSTPRCRSTSAPTRCSASPRSAADLLVQEYGRYFGMPTVCFRGGCLTGPQHAGAQLHGFLAYLMSCTVTGTPYTIFGYGGKQVRDNIHAHDVVRRVLGLPRRSAAGRGLQPRRWARLERLDARGDRRLRARSPGRELDYTLSDEARIGDHRWWISDLAGFQADYPGWRAHLRHRGRAARHPRGQRRGVDRHDGPQRSGP